ncbi:hypothetical protein Hanom_Chr02g00120831 [Helianthus anomalus]
MVLIALYNGSSDRMVIRSVDHSITSILSNFLTFQYFEFLLHIKTLPWWDIEELVQTKNIKQFYYGTEVKCHYQRLWNYIKLHAKEKFLDWKPHQPKQIVKIDPVTEENDITLKIRQPRCLKNMPLRAMERDIHEDFKGWLYNQSTTEAVITLFDVKTGDCRHMHVLDPMWLVNYSKKDIECLFFNKIVYNEPDKVQAQQYQNIVMLALQRISTLEDIGRQSLEINENLRNRSPIYHWDDNIIFSGSA